MFEDLVILDLSLGFSGPLAARLFADRGATVIKVERPGGDISRQLAWVANGRSGYFVQQNRGKLGVCIDLKASGGKELLWRLIERSDVLIDGFAAGVLAGLGFSAREMSKRNEALVICEISALGRSGPLGGARGYDYIGACFSGVAYTASSGDAPPVMPNVAMGDAMMAMAAYGGILSALYERQKSGKGQRVEATLVDAYIQSHSSNLEGESLSGGKFQVRPVGAQNASTCPSGAFRAPDGKWMYIVAVSREEWTRLCNCLGVPELISDPRYLSNDARLAHRSEVLDLLQSWIDKCATRDAAVSALLAAGVATAPVLSVRETIDHPHLRERGTVEFIDDNVLGSFAVPGPPFFLSRTERTEPKPAPRLGEHNRYVFEQIGGLGPDEIDEHAAAGGLVSE